jgi:hypothetical protein
LARTRWCTITIENKIFNDVNKTQVKGLDLKHDSINKRNESIVDNETSYTGVVKGNMR